MSGCHNGAPGCIRVWRDGDRDRATDFIAKQTDTLSKVCGNITGIDQVDEQRVVYYPNPSDGSFTIVCPSMKVPFEYEIYNMVGERLLYGISTDNDITLKRDLKSGIYFLKVGDNKNTEMLRLSIR